MKHLEYSHRHSHVECGGRKARLYYVNPPYIDPNLDRETYARLFRAAIKERAEHFAQLIRTRAIGAEVDVFSYFDGQIIRVFK